MNRWLLSAVFVCVIALPAFGLAQDAKDTPSQKTREALEKFNQAPAAVAKGLETLKEAVIGKSGEGSGSGEKAPAAADPFAIPERKPEPAGAPHYSSAGKRDPFQPLPLKVQAKRRPRENLSPLERYDVGQLQLVGIVWGAKEPWATVEVMESDKVIRPYLVKVGTAIGSNEGKVKEIRPTEVVIEESYIDFYGARKVRQFSMKLRSE